MQEDGSFKEQLKFYTKILIKSPGIFLKVIIKTIITLFLLKKTMIYGKKLCQSFLKMS